MTFDIKYDFRFSVRPSSSPRLPFPGFQVPSTLSVQFQDQGSIEEHKSQQLYDNSHQHEILANHSVL